VRYSRVGIGDAWYTINGHRPSHHEQDKATRVEDALVVVLQASLNGIRLTRCLFVALSPTCLILKASKPRLTRSEYRETSLKISIKAGENVAKRRRHYGRACPLPQVPARQPL
jgi:hypothetical protein